MGLQRSLSASSVKSRNPAESVPSVDRILSLRSHAFEGVAPGRPLLVAAVHDADVAEPQMVRRHRGVEALRSGGPAAVEDERPCPVGRQPLRVEQPLRTSGIDRLEGSILGGDGDGAGQVPVPVVNLVPGVDQHEALAAIHHAPDLRGGDEADTEGLELSVPGRLRGEAGGDGGGQYEEEEERERGAARGGLSMRRRPTA